jgi:2-polyprenyl-6-hydroxyphenyl methylase/3-demethylubiquinone-9 3-methyltransferase
MLHWIAAARARLVPRAVRADALLLDVACGGGLLAPHVREAGYRHVGVDVSPTAVRVARDHGVGVVHADALRLPFRDGTFDVVVAEACRVLRVGGTLVIDTIAATWWGRFLSVTVGERIPAGPPRRLHDPALFVDRDRLQDAAARHGVPLRLNGLRLHPVDYLGWLLRRRDSVRMVPGRGTAALFQAVGVKEEG